MRSDCDEMPHWFRCKVAVRDGVPDDLRMGDTRHLCCPCGAFPARRVFSGVLSPRARPGSCQVIRPYDTEAQRTSVAGMCSGQLPQYVASFNGQSSYVDIPHSSMLGNSAEMSFSFWVASSGGGEVLAQAASSYGGANYWISISNSGNVVHTIRQPWAYYDSRIQILSNTWTQIVLETVSASDQAKLICKWRSRGRPFYKRRFVYRYTGRPSNRDAEP